MLKTLPLPFWFTAFALAGVSIGFGMFAYINPAGVFSASSTVAVGIQWLVLATVVFFAGIGLFVQKILPDLS